jgi:hypothetical protein
MENGVFTYRIATIRRYFDLRSKSRLHSEVKDVLHQIPIDFGGGCSLSKAYLMAELIRWHDLQVTVDIGVYRGRSLFPQAVSHRSFTNGVAYGIDPWSATEAKQYDCCLELRKKIGQFLERTDFEDLYQGVKALINKYKLEDHCFLLRCTSAGAISFFNENELYFDMIHIDGNHDTRIVMNDVNSYLPRLKKNGFVFLDDASWESVKPAYEQIKSSMSLIFKRRDQKNDYAVFWNGTSRFHALTLRLATWWLARGSD